MNRHRLYEVAVQSPEADVAFFERVWSEPRPALTLREDFAGTALIAAAWVESDDDREAVAVEHDAELVREAEARRAAMDEEESERVTIVRGDVRALSDRCFDLIVAMNFSWAIFDDAALAAYLASARACLEDDGLLVLERFGGPALAAPCRDEHPHDGFTYVWEQRGARDGWLDARIHFELDDGAALMDAFRYRFRLRSLDEERALLRAAGFRELQYFVEDRRGRYAVRQREPSWPRHRGAWVGRPGGASRVETG